MQLAGGTRSGGNQFPSAGRPRPVRGSRRSSARPAHRCRPGGGSGAVESPPGQSGARRLSSRRLTAGAPTVNSVAQAQGAALGPLRQLSQCHLPGAAPGDYPPGDLGSPPEVQHPETILPETRDATNLSPAGAPARRCHLPGNQRPGDYPPGDSPREPPPSVAWLRRGAPPSAPHASCHSVTSRALPPETILPATWGHLPRCSTRRLSSRRHGLRRICHRRGLQCGGVTSRAIRGPETILPETYRGSPRLLAAPSRAARCHVRDGASAGRRRAEPVQPGARPKLAGPPSRPRGSASSARAGEPRPKLACPLAAPRPAEPAH